VAAFGCDELWDEGKEEERSFRVESFGEDALTESAARRCRAFNGSIFLHGDITRADHFYAEEDEIGGTGVLDCVEGYGGGGEDGRDSEGSGEDVEESTEESADRGLKTFAAASGEGAGEDVEDAGPGSDSEKQGGGEEECETMGIEHKNILAGEWNCTSRKTVDADSSRNRINRPSRKAASTKFRSRKSDYRGFFSLTTISHARIFEPRHLVSSGRPASLLAIAKNVQECKSAR
jgi:hypothetical protein